MILGINGASELRIVAAQFGGMTTILFLILEADHLIKK